MMNTPVNIAPKTWSGADLSCETSPASTSQAKSFACFNCANRKTKCDKERPSCTACRRRELTCVYEDSANSRKRKATEDANGRLERFERILKERGLAEKGGSKQLGTASDAPISPSITVVSQEAEMQKTGRLISDGKNSRYIDSSLWRELEHNGFREIAEEQVCDPVVDSSDGFSAAFTPDVLSRGLLGSTEDVSGYHPSPTDASRLWDIYAENVEPLYKFLHTPTTRKLVLTRSQNLSSATSADHCLLFAIYLLAVFSLSDDACRAEFGRARADLLSTYDHAFRQALYNASWLSTNDVSVLLAFVMYLCVVRRQTEARSFWVWTGMGIRIMQRMGIHRDGEAMGLRPFEIELRRRLYWHLVSLDIWAGRISGTSDAGPHHTWDTKLPSNINDDQIFLDMTERPCVRPGATEMMFSLVRTKLGPLSAGATGPLIDTVENEIEANFLRYCDPVEPLHVLTLTTARSVIAASRLRLRMQLLARPSSDNKEAEKLEVFDLARRILDADNSIFQNAQMRPFLWNVKAFFRWDALICLLALLARPGFFALQESQGAWKRIGKFFTNHPEFLEKDSGILPRSMGLMTLKAWLASSASDHDIEPEYITTLRSLHAGSASASHPKQTARDTGMSELGLYSSSEADAPFDIDALLSSGLFAGDGGWDDLFGGSPMMSFEM